MGGNVSSKLSKFYFFFCIIRFWVQFISAAQRVKFQEFSGTFFREINFRDFGGPKTAILAHLEALNFKFS